MQRSEVELAIDTIVNAHHEERHHAALGDDVRRFVVAIGIRRDTIRAFICQRAVALHQTSSLEIAEELALLVGEVSPLRPSHAEHRGESRIGEDVIEAGSDVAIMSRAREGEEV